MSDDFDEIMAGLSPERRAKIEARAAELIAEEMTLQALRKNQNLTQANLAKTLGVDQGEISRIEQRSDLYLSTLQKVVSGMGGKLSLVVEMPNNKKIVLKGLGDLSQG